MNCQCIDENVWLSDREFASCGGCLQIHSITGVLTVDSEELVVGRCEKHALYDEEWKGEQKFIWMTDQVKFNMRTC